jgi:hypothetical protein
MWRVVWRGVEITATFLAKDMRLQIPEMLKHIEQTMKGLLKKIKTEENLILS